MGTCSVESTEIDLTEFQEENQEEGDVEPQIADVDADSNNDQPGCYFSLEKMDRN